MAMRRPAPPSQPGEWAKFHGKRMSEAEFLALDDAEETDLEYIDGVAVEKGMVDRNHGLLAGKLTTLLWLYGEQQGGESGPERRVRLPGGQLRKPDVAYWKPGIPTGNDSIPTLAIEIRSPDDTMANQRRKCREFRDGGVQVAWLIDPVSRSIEVFEGERDADLVPVDSMLTSEYLPGFVVSVAEVLAVLDTPAV